MSASFLFGPAMAPNNDNQGATAGVFRDALSQVLGATCLIMVGTCLSMWSTQRLIEQSIANIVKSDAEQGKQIDRLREDVNSLRIDLGIQRGRLIDVSRRVGAP